MTGLAQWAVPVAERRRLRFSFQNQQCQRADRRSRPQPDLSITEPLSEEGRPVQGARFLVSRDPCVNHLCAVRRSGPSNRPKARSAASREAPPRGQPRFSSRSEVKHFSSSAEDLVDPAEAKSTWSQPPETLCRSLDQLRVSKWRAASSEAALRGQPLSAEIVQQKQHPICGKPKSKRPKSLLISGRPLQSSCRLLEPTFDPTSRRAVFTDRLSRRQPRFSEALQFGAPSTLNKPERGSPGADITPTFELPSFAERLNSMERFARIRKTSSPRARPSCVSAAALPPPRTRGVRPLPRRRKALSQVFCAFVQEP